MKGKKEFHSGITLGPHFADRATGMLVKNEPMFFNSDLHFAMDKGGYITRSFLTSLPSPWWEEDVVFDSRVHMLMPGWWPAIPGFHHDDVPRPPVPPGAHFISAGQPDYDNPRYHSDHVCGLVNAHIAPTRFALGDCVMPEIPEGELIYRVWHREVENALEKGTLAPFDAPDRVLIYFNWQTFHKAVKAVDVGWRWFGRVSRNTDRVGHITNEIRKQAQVYLEFPMEGW